MTTEVWLAIGGFAVAIIAWVGRFAGWFTSKHGRYEPDGPASTMQGSEWTPVNDPGSASDTSGFGGGNS